MTQCSSLLPVFTHTLCGFSSNQALQSVSVLQKFFHLSIVLCSFPLLCDLTCCSHLINFGLPLGHFACTVILTVCLGLYPNSFLTFKWPTFLYVNTHKKHSRNSFYMFGQRGNLRIFKACYIISVSFSTKCHLFHNSIFVCSNHTHAFHKPCTKI
jgi:hypothetical protein